MKLTEKRVAGLAPVTERRRDIAEFDDAVPGFGVRVKPSGAKSYILWYRTCAGLKRLYTIGPAGAYKVEQARQEARELLVKIKKGADPVQERKEARSGDTVAELCDRYLADHATPHKKPSAVKSDARLIEANIKSSMGAKKIVALSSADVSKLHRDMRKTPYEANRTLAVLRKMLNLAEIWGLRPANSNPCRGVKPFKELKRERFLSLEELRRLGEALAEAERNGTQISEAILAIKLLALTGCRVGEILSATWDRVNLSAGQLRLADGKSGARMVPLGAPAIALLSAQPKGSPWVVPAPGGNGPLSYWSLETVWRRVRVVAELGDARLHDLRHTIGTFAGQAGLNAFLVRDLLGHKTLAMTGRYVERDADPLRAAANVVSERIAAAMAVGKDAEVVEMAKAKTHPGS
jgi:integrase